MAFMSSLRKPDAAGEASELRRLALFPALSKYLFPVSPDGSTALRDYRILASLVGLAGLVALAAIPRMPALVAPLGLALGWLYYLIFARRERRRLKLLNQPFPEVFRDTLLQRVPLYSQLTELERRRFEGRADCEFVFPGRHVREPLHDPMRPSREILKRDDIGQLRLDEPRLRLGIWQTTTGGKSAVVGADPGHLHVSGKIHNWLRCLAAVCPVRTTRSRNNPRLVWWSAVPFVCVCGVDGTMYVEGTVWWVLGLG